MPSIYFISDVDANFLKVGYSKDPESRFKHHQSACPITLELLGSVVGTLPHEQELHKHLSDFRVRGEWFQRNKETESLMKDVLYGWLPVAEIASRSIWPDFAMTGSFRCITCEKRGDRDEIAMYLGWASEVSGSLLCPDCLPNTDKTGFATIDKSRFKLVGDPSLMEPEPRRPSEFFTPSPSPIQEVSV